MIGSFYTKISIFSLRKVAFFCYSEPGCKGHFTSSPQGPRIRRVAKTFSNEGKDKLSKIIEDRENF